MSSVQLSLVHVTNCVGLRAMSRLMLLFTTRQAIATGACYGGPMSKSLMFALIVEADKHQGITPNA